MRIGSPERFLGNDYHNFLDRQYVVQNSVITYGGAESELEGLLAGEDLFRDTVRQLHCSDEGLEWTFVKANNAGRARGTYENFDLFAVSKVNLMGGKAIRSSVFELKKDNSAQSLYTALTQAISYRNRRIANYVWIIAPGFNAEQFVGSNFDGLMKQCIENGIGVLDIALSAGDGTAVQDINKRLDAKWSAVEDPRVVNNVLQESGWSMCPLCQEHYRAEMEGATRFCRACTDALREIAGNGHAG